MKHLFMILALSVLPAATAQAQCPCDVELLQNPGCDESLVGGEIPGWTEVVGNGWTRRSSNPPPLEGPGYFFAAEGDTAELAQVVDCFGEYGTSGVRLFGAIRTGNENPSDLARIVFEFLSQDGIVLSSFDSGEVSSPAEWTTIFRCCEGDPSARYVRVRLIGIRRSGAELDAYFDSLSVYINCPLPVETSTWGQIKNLNR